MPTRLQDGMSISLLRWAMVSAPDESRTVDLRLVNTAVMKDVLHDLEILISSYGGLEIISSERRVIRVTVTAKTIIQLKNISSIYAIIEASP